MNETYIVTTFVVIDEILKAHGYQDDVRSQCSAAEVLTISVVAAKYFQNHHERALCLMSRLGYVGKLSVSRFNRRLHQLKDWLLNIVTLLGELFVGGEVFLIDSMPLPVCKRARAMRAAKYVVASFVAIVRRRKRSFLAGVYI
jgi:hypothetical protein